MKDQIFRLTPLGRADIELRQHFEDDEEFYSSDEYEEYEASRKKYRNRKLVQMSIKTLLYAGVITSVAASFGVPHLRIINQIASYIGVTFLLMLYAVALYTASLQKEEYHLKREILVSNAKKE
ncbi:hypothetical protein ACK3SF_00365 [Candidatus Nanosalina sp. VS9-1]|uniref:hypothetical protein n=1 Tax=Candidatus Nanosalina sp. VS9-1 TaxID=3388566 RepID=UPI0039DF6120